MSVPERVEGLLDKYAETWRRRGVDARVVESAIEEAWGWLSGSRRPIWADKRRAFAAARERILQSGSDVRKLLTCSYDPIRAHARALLDALEDPKWRRYYEWWFEFQKRPRHRPREPWLAALRRRLTELKVSTREVRELVSALRDATVERAPWGDGAERKGKRTSAVP